MPRIVVVGSLNMDLVTVSSRLPVPGETLTGNSFFTAPGGKGANQACAAARLGGDVGMLGRVGSDAFGENLKGSLGAVGCDVTGVAVVTDGPSGIAAIYVSEAGHNMIVVVPGANGRYDPQSFEADQHRLDGAAEVLLQLEIPMETVCSAAAAARRAGAELILDPAPAVERLPADLLRCVDILTPNETEACRLTGSRASELTVKEAEAVAWKLKELGDGAVIVKLGAQGCVLATGNGSFLVRAPAVDAVDTTAAGDAFNGALAVARADGLSLPDACRFAVGAAAVSVTRLGAQQSMAGRGEIGEMIGSTAMEALSSGRNVRSGT